MTMPVGRDGLNHVGGRCDAAAVIPAIGDLKGL
jgi:hypothetical protein